MRTSHKHTHTPLLAGLGSNWLRLMVTVLFLGGLAVVITVRSGRWTAKANEVDEARARLQAAKAQYLANPTKESTANFDQALAAYKAALKANPAAPAAPSQGQSTPVESAAFNYGISERLSDIAPAPPSPSAAKLGIRRKNETNEIPLRSGVNTPTNKTDSVIQGSLIPGQNLVTNPIVNFDGVDMDDQAAVLGRFAPPDTNGDVGPNHIVEVVNSAIRIYNKSGTPLTGVIILNQLFDPLGGACTGVLNGNDGDPIVLYDPLADRWLISEFCLTFTNGRMHELIAISKTGDPTGAYFLYDFLMPSGRFTDYPHLGVWPDGYYMTTNDFNTAGTVFLGDTFFAFNRAKMLVGDPTANYIAFVNNFGSNPVSTGGFLPTDMDGLTPPPVGTPNLITQFLADEFGDPTDGLRIAAFHADFANPAASTLTILPDVPLAAFDARQPNSRRLIDQPPPATANDSLDAIADRLMHRQAYRTLSGGVQSYVLNFTVNVSGVNPTNSATYQAGVRWVELRRNAGTGAVTVNQQATYAPGAGDGANGRNLWMASVAQDGEGNIGLAANASSTTLIPTAVYAGRLAGDPAGTLPQGEVDAMSAVTRGVQIGTGSRWGDYSNLSVDPADECTFWGFFEYVDAPTASFDWNTRVFSFKVNPACVTPAKGMIQGQATNAVTNAPIQNVNVTTPEGYFRATDAGGNYSMMVAPGTYSVTCSKAGFTSVTGTATVAGGGTATFNCAMQPIPVISLSGSTITAENCATDGRADPGETLSVQVCFNNTGTLDTTNLVVALAATGGVTNPTPASQSYGVVTAGGAAVCKTFTFRVDPALTCGSNVVATFTATDGAANLGTFTLTFPSGTPVVTFAENFDGVTAPALPAGWTAATSGAPLPAPVTSTTAPDTAPNDVFSPDVATGVTGTGRVNELVSPSILISSSSAQLSFRNLFNMEGGFDGCVLEIKIGAGAFTDIIAAGGSFVSGGYTGTLSTNFGNPLGGRSAWTGLSAGTAAAPAYVNTLVNLPASANGQNIQLRFRTGVDDSVVATGAAGWRIDTIRVLGALTCCGGTGTSITPTASLTDPLACTGPGNTVNGVTTVTNPTASTLNGGNITISLQTGLSAIPGSCTATVGGVNAGTCSVVNASTIVWTGSLAGNATLTINYQAQVGDVLPGTQLCAGITGGFTGVSLTSVTACVVVNCQAVGPGALPLATSPMSDQKAGSVLIYNVYTSSTNSIQQNTRLNLTNTNPNLPAIVHLFFVDGTSCSVADSILCLTANQTTSFLASDLDPGSTGYVVAVAVDATGCPTNFNYLIGDEYVKFATGHAANLGAEAISAIAGGLPACNTNSTTATLAFDGISYSVVPHVLAADNIPSRADGNDTLLILNRIGGNLGIGAGTLGTIFGLFYDDTETGVSFSLSAGACQFRSSINNTTPRITPRFEQFVPAGRSGWFKVWVPGFVGMTGAILNANPNAGTSAGAFNQGHNLHKLTNTNTASYLIPVFPPGC